MTTFVWTSTTLTLPVSFLFGLIVAPLVPAVVYTPPEFREPCPCLRFNFLTAFIFFSRSAQTLQSLHFTSLLVSERSIWLTSWLVWWFVVRSLLYLNILVFRWRVATSLASLSQFTFLIWSGKSNWFSYQWWGFVFLRLLLRSIHSRLTFTTSSYHGQIVSYEKILMHLFWRFAIDSFLELTGLSVKLFAYLPNAAWNQLFTTIWQCRTSLVADFRAGYREPSCIFVIKHRIPKVRCIGLI